MYISNIKIKNFRALKDVSIDTEKDLSLIIGKNNVGKTSLLLIMDKFLNGDRKDFNINDVNLEKLNELGILLNNNSITENFILISMELKIKYSVDECLANISDIIVDLNPDKEEINLLFELIITPDKLRQLKDDFNKKKDLYRNRTIIDFLSKKSAYFDINIKSVLYDDVKTPKNTFIIIEEKVIEKKDLVNLISFKSISAKREIRDSDNSNQSEKKVLSKYSSKYYSKNIEDDEFENLHKELVKMDDTLNERYDEAFKKIIKAIKDFGGKTNIKIKSTLEGKNLLSSNTTVVYENKSKTLPEEHSGLGYLNLYSLVFDIFIKFDEFARTGAFQPDPADINILFVEEPEAHTHPQMQYTFINNIGKMLEEGEKELKGKKLQTFMTTHSSHIVSQSNFDDVKYLMEKDDGIEVKNLKNLKAEYSEENTFRFLKKYLKLENSELFFADKVIFVEGDTERILMPSMMKKVDKELGVQEVKTDKDDNTQEAKNTTKKLLSQNISIVPIGGAYAHKFKPFLEFFNIKSLIITDLDSVDDSNKAIKVDKNSETQKTSNSSIKVFLGEGHIKNLCSTEFKKEVSNENVLICYQTEENSYIGRSFEDAFISIKKNFDFIKEHKNNFESLQNKDMFDGKDIDYFDIANKCFKKQGGKTNFAIDILFHSGEDNSEWEVPAYIQEGLKWLAK